VPPTMSLRLLVAGASAVGAGTLTSYFLLSDTTVSTLRCSSVNTIVNAGDFLEIARAYVLDVEATLILSNWYDRSKRNAI